MSDHPKTLTAMKSSVQVGTLLAKMTIVGHRDKSAELVAIVRELQERIDKAEADINRPYMAAFVRFLELHSKIFAETAISHIKDYTRNTTTALKPEVPAILWHLVVCIGQRDILLDACLDQNGIVHTLMFFLHTTIEDLGKLSGSWIDDSFLLITAIALILGKAFLRAGAPLIALALREHLLEAITSMLRIFNIPGRHHPQMQYIDQPLSGIIDLILANVVYPSILKPVLGISHTFDLINAIDKPPSQLSSSNSALIRLCRRLSDEFSILKPLEGSGGRKAYLKAYRFCDNIHCPHIWNTTTDKKLGRCTACHSGYYCSRSCQKVVWRTGHRKECKMIAAGIKDGEGGFPPVLVAHDIEYFRRTLSDRLRFYRKESQIPEVGENDVVSMDFTTFPVKFLTCDAGEPGLEGPSRLLAKAKFPTCTRLGDGVEITLSEP